MRARGIVLVFLLIGGLVGINVQAQYCIPAFGSTNNSISNFTCKNMNNSSGAADLGYEDFSGIGVIDVTAGEVVNFTFDVSSTATRYSKLFIDWDRSNSFEEPAERFLNISGTAAQKQGSFTVPAGACGNYRLRVYFTDVDGNAGPCNTDDASYWGEAEDYTIYVRNPSNPTSINGITMDVPNTNGFPRGTNQEVISFNIDITGCTEPYTLKGGRFNLGDSDDEADINTAYLYYTGSNNAYSTANMVGFKAVSGNTFEITGDQQLGTGNNYFWIAYNVPGNATVDNYVDAEIDELLIDDGSSANWTSAITGLGNPGRRQIINNYCSPSVTNAMSTARSIKRVRVKSIDHTNSDITTPHIDRSLVDVIEVVPGETQALRVNWDQGNIISIGTPVYFSVYAWIDWDRDGVFSDAERYYIGKRENNPAGTESMDVTEYFTVPRNTQGGFTKMRIRLMYNQAPAPCGATPYGQSIDFGVKICGQGFPVLSGDICSNTGVLALSNPNDRFTPYEWETSTSVNGPWSATGVSDADYSIPTLTSSLYVRAKMFTEGCTNDEGFSSIYSAIRPNTTTVTANPSSLCPGDSALLETTYTYATSLFGANPAADIPDVPTAAAEPGAAVVAQIDLSGESITPAEIDRRTVNRFCLRISHPDVSELRGKLRHNGSGKEVLLFDRNLNGTDLTDVCFTSFATADISTGTSPYTGDFKAPEQFMTFLGEDPNSIWSLVVEDFVEGNVGTIDSLTMEFGGGSVEWTPNQNLRTEFGDSTRAQPTVDTYYKPGIILDGCTFYGDSVLVTPAGNTTAQISITDSSLTFPFCSGESVSFTATALEFPAGSSYAWELNGVDQGNNSDVFSSATLADGDILAVILNIVTPCISISDTDTVVIDIIAPFNLDMNLSTTGSGLICEGTDNTFELDIPTGGGNPLIEWFKATSTGQTLVNTGDSSYTDFGTLQDGDSIIVKLTAEESCAIPQIIYDTIEVSLTPVTNIALTLDATYPPDMCSGLNIHFETDTGTGTPYATELIWTLNGDTIPVDSNEWDVDTLAGGNYRVAVEFKSEGCASPNSVTKFVDFDLIQTTEKEVHGKQLDPFNCAGDSVTYVAFDYGGAGANPSFNWYRGNILLDGPGLHEDTIYLSQGTHNETITVEIVGQGSGACLLDLGNGVDSFDAIIKPTTQASIEIFSDAILKCEGDSVEFGVSELFGEGDSPTFDWHINGVYSATTVEPVWYKDNLPLGAEVTAVLNSSLLCVNPKIPVSEALQILHEPEVVPSAIVSLTHEKSCLGEVVIAQLSNKANLGEKPNVRWFFNDEEQLGLNGLSFQYQTTQPGTDELYAIVESSETCPSVEEFTTNTAINEVNEDPIADFAYETNGMNAIFVAQESGQGTYVWNFNGEGTSQGETASYTFTTSGKKTVCLVVTDENGCTNEFCQEVEIAVGIDNIAPSIVYSVYPNPVEGKLFLKSNAEQVRLFNPIGQVLLTKDLNKDGSGELNMEALPAGIYQLVFQKGSKQTTTRVIKH